MDELPDIMPGIEHPDADIAEWLPVMETITALIAQAFAAVAWWESRHIQAMRIRDDE